MRTTVLDYKRLDNSVHGNPRYEFRFLKLGSAKTESDAGWVYALTPYDLVGKEVDIEYRTTPTGRIVLEDLQEVQQ